MSMTKNDAYTYARVYLRRKQLQEISYVKLEDKMKAENFSSADIELVKEWIRFFGSGKSLETLGRKGRKGLLTE